MQYRSPRSWFFLLAVALAATGVACGGDGNNSPAGSPLSPALPSPVGPGPIAPNATIVAAGDVGVCGRAEVEATARLIDAIPGTVLGLGDLAYPAGSAQDFANCYDPSWGRHRGRTRPTPGNHEYQAAGATPYYDYFGENAGPRGLGYYSFSEGAWLVISLNSNVAADTGSAQIAWLRSTLAQHPAKCTLAYWHHPLFSSGPHGSNAQMRTAWRILQDAGADVVLVGHEHLYERFAPQTSDGAPGGGGMRQFVVGTGGAAPGAARAAAANSEVVGGEEGVLRMTLKPDSYDWQFVPIAGKRFADAGSAVCR